MNFTLQGARRGLLALLVITYAHSAMAEEASRAASAMARTVHLVTTEYPPFMGEKLPGQGLVMRIATAAMERSGYTVKTTFMPWARAMDMTRAGAADGIAGAWRTPERELSLAYTNTVTSTRIGLFKRADNPFRYETLADLKPYTIGVVRGYANPVAFDEAHLKTEEATDDETNLRKLAGHRLQFVLIEKAVAQGLLKSSLPQLKSSVVWMEPAINVLPLYVAFSRNVKNHDELLAAFNAGLESLRKDGSLAKWAAEAGS